MRTDSREQESTAQFLVLVLRVFGIEWAIQPVDLGKMMIRPGFPEPSRVLVQLPLFYVGNIFRGGRRRTSQGKNRKGWPMTQIGYSSVRYEVGRIFLSTHHNVKNFELFVLRIHGKVRALL
jgi:hypothetical protein